MLYYLNANYNIKAARMDLYEFFNCQIVMKINSMISYTFCGKFAAHIYRCNLIAFVNKPLA